MESSRSPSASTTFQRTDFIASLNLVLQNAAGRKPTDSVLARLSAGGLHRLRGALDEASYRFRLGDVHGVASTGLDHRGARAL